jgi:cellulase
MLNRAVTVLSLAAAVSAHGHVATVIADGVEYPGAVPGQTNAETVGWPAQNLDNGFVEPASVGDVSIACHKSATPGSNGATVAAGGSVTVQWDTWPESHHGPVIDYIAKVDGDFASADASSLQFAKIAESGLISGNNPGTWASDDLIANGNAWTIEIPSSLAAGNYVLRHEIIALHSAGNANGAQFYPQCVNLVVTGGGSATPSGASATSFYSASDPGVLFNLYEAFDSYTIPGPALWSA